MIELDNNEAILFRILTSFFGKDRVIPQMSILAACGGELPSNKFPIPEQQSTSLWARKNKCLFTIINDADCPRLVVELGVDVKSSVDIMELDKQERTKSILNAAGVAYIILSRSELLFITDPQSPDNWFHLLQSKFEEAAATLAA